jgi:hypothetical protein
MQRARRRRLLAGVPVRRLVLPPCGAPRFWLPREVSDNATPTSASTALAAIQPAFADAGQLGLAGYCLLTREARTLDLRQFTGWCRVRFLPLFLIRCRHRDVRP